MAVDYRVRLKIAQRQYVQGVEDLRRQRDEAVVAANREGGVTCQEIASLCEMSYGNARKIVSAGTAAAKTKRTRRN